MAEADDDTEEGGAAPAASTPTAGTTPAAPPPSGPDFTSLVKSPEDMAPLTKQLGDIQRAKTASDTANADETIKRLGTDRARMEAAYKASATMPDELKQGWDAKAKTAEHSTDPVQAFGSVGSVFAMLASSFAGLPMEHALNAGAAAINAVHAGDEKAYQKEYDAWKANTDLAVKRQAIQHQTYNDATNLMNSNINAGRAKMELAATRFGDQKAQALLDAGMDKELFQLFSDRNKAALETQSSWDKVQLEHTKVMDLKSDPRFNDPATKEAAIADWTQRWSGAAKAKYDTVLQLQKTWDNEHPQAGFDERKEAFVGIEKSVAEAKDTGTAGSGGPLSAPKARQQEIDRRKAQYIGEGLSETDAYNKAVREVELARAVPSGNRVDDLRGKVDQARNIIAGSEKNLDFLENYKLGAGLAGKVMRGEEIAENITGISDKSDRAQFRRRILELQEMAPRILTDSNGRPLKSAQDKIDGIVAGLNAGDTGPNTIRAYRELIEDMKHRVADYDTRLKGGPTPGGQPAGAATPADTGGSSGSRKAPWQNDPIVKPRADVGTSGSTDFSAQRRSVERTDDNSQRGEPSEQERLKGRMKLTNEMYGAVDPDDGDYYRSSMYNAARSAEGIRKYEGDR